MSGLLVFYVNGWLLDVCLDGEDGVVLWVRSGGGVFHSRMRWEARFYVAGPETALSSVEKALSEEYVVNSVVKRVLGVGLTKVLEVSVPALRKRNLAILVEEKWRHEGIKVFNIDIPLTQEFLYQFNVAPTLRVRVSDEDVVAVEDADNLVYDTSFLRTAFLEAGIHAQGPLPTFLDRLVYVKLSMGDEEVVLDGGEEQILTGLMELLDEWDVDVLVTVDGDGFLIPYLRRRAWENMVELRLGRMSDYRKNVVKGFSYHSYGRVVHRFRGCKLRGRIHIDAANSMLYSETGLEGVVEVARTGCIPIQDAARYTIGRCMTSFQYRQAYINGVLIPFQSGRPEYMTSAELLVADRGGWILDHRPGVYWNVGELDFHSLYPMLMLKNNISGETVNCDCCDGEDIPELGYHVCRKWRGIVPSAVEKPLQRRLMYKKLYAETGSKVFKARADALKWVLVTSFGYLGYRKAKFGSRMAHMAVCALARDVLLKSVSIAEEEGFKVLHGIVDCLWVWRKDASEEDYRELGKAIEERLGLPIGYEGTFKWIVFLPSRIHPSRPVNNRYFGVYVDGRLKSRGIELRRRDTPPIVKAMQEEVLAKLAEAGTPDELRMKALESREILNKYLRMLYIGLAPPEELVIAKSLSRPPDLYMKKLKHVEAAKTLKQVGAVIEPGQIVSYLVRKGGVIPSSLFNSKEYDEEFYASLLRRCFMNIVSPVLLYL